MKKKRLRSEIISLSNQSAYRAFALIYLKNITNKLLIHEVDSYRINQLNLMIRIVNAGLEK